MALNVAALAGDILLASGAEIFRVEETIDRIAHAYGIESCDPFVLSSGFFLTADSNSDQNFAWVRHIPLSATRLDRVTAVNQLSREIEHGSYTRRKPIRNFRKSSRCLPSGISARSLLPAWAADASVISSAAIRWTVSWLLSPVCCCMSICCA